MHVKYSPFIATTIALLLIGTVVQRVSAQSRNGRSKNTATSPNAPVQTPTGDPIGKRITFTDGATLDVDDTWKQGNSVWYRLKGTSQSINQEVRSIEFRYPDASPPGQSAVTTAPPKIPKPAPVLATWIYLSDGARLRVDEVQEVSDGVWYNRNNLNIFVARDRINRIEREQPEKTNGEWKEQGWSSGSPLIDDLIRTNASRFGVDPYLVFLVTEQESHFHPRALSPKGARGLMQLMPGTARRFGVLKPFDPGQNIRGGTQYLKDLLAMFGGRVDLALASYNAGEGRVLQYGNRVPPFKETQEYVRRISKRYRQPNETKN